MSRSGMPCRTRMRPPRFRTKDVSTCMGSPTARGSSIRKPFARGGCCLLVSELDRHLGIRPVSQLDTQPVVSPVNASRLPSRAETSCITRGRGGWLGLTPWKTCTSYPLPAFLALSGSGQSRREDFVRCGGEADMAKQERDAKCHVWTAPRWQGLSSHRRSGRSGHVFGLLMRLA